MEGGAVFKKAVHYHCYSAYTPLHISVSGHSFAYFEVEGTDSGESAFGAQVRRTIQ